MSTDAQIRTMILVNFGLDPAVSRNHIQVGVRGGGVTLTGEVQSEADRATAERLARLTAGVLSVKNHLMLAGSMSSALDDEQIHLAARHALWWVLPNCAASLRSRVAQGWLTLEGEVFSERQKLAADAALRFIEGVRGIVNHLVVRQIGASNCAP